MSENPRVVVDADRDSFRWADEVVDLPAEMAVPRSDDARDTDCDVGIETVEQVAGLLVDDEFEASTVLVVTTAGFTVDATQRSERISALELVDGSAVVTRGQELGRSLHGQEHEYETELTDDQVLSVLERGEPVTTVEVADALETNSRSVVVHLESLVEDGEIRVKRIGDEYGVWYR